MSVVVSHSPITRRWGRSASQFCEGVCHAHIPRRWSPSAPQFWGFSSYDDTLKCRMTMYGKVTHGSRARFLGSAVPLTPRGQIPITPQFLFFAVFVFTPCVNTCMSFEHQCHVLHVVDTQILLCMRLTRMVESYISQISTRQKALKPSHRFDCVGLLCALFFVFCLLVVLVWLSVPVQVFDWKDSSLKLPIMC